MKTLLIAAATAAIAAMPAAADHHGDDDSTEGVGGPDVAIENIFTEDADPTPVRDAAGHLIMSEKALTPEGYYTQDGLTPEQRAEAMQRIESFEYPVCGNGQTDRCVNPGAS